MTRPPGEGDTPQNDTSVYLEEARAGDGPILELGCGTGGYRGFMGFSARLPPKAEVGRL